MKKWIKITLGVIFVVWIMLSVASRLLLSKEFLVTEIEDSINSRVQIGDFDVSLFSIPARVTLEEVIVAKRDRYANQKVSYAERPPLESGAITLKGLSFKVSLWELISKKIDVEHFELEGLHVRAVLYEDGTNSLDALFAEPENKQLEEELQTARKEGEFAEIPEGNSFNAKEQKDFVTHLRSVRIEDVSFDLVLQKANVLVSGSKCGVELNHIKIDPNALEVVNKAQVQLHSTLRIYEGNHKLQSPLGVLSVDGSAQVRLFDPQSGDIDPDLTLDLNLGKDSYLRASVAYIEKLWKYTERLKKWGVDIGSLPQKVTFGRSQKLKGTYYRGRIDLDADVALVVKGWELALKAPSWFSSADEQHTFFIDLSANAKQSRSVESRVNKYLGKRLGAVIQKDLFQNGKLTLQMDTSGELSSPRVKLKNKLPRIKESVKEYAKEKALDFLKKLKR